MNKRKSLVLFVLMICVMSLHVGARATFEKQNTATYTGSAGKITVYLSGPAQMTEKLEKVFESKHGDVLDIVSMGCGPLRQRVWAEFETGTIHADVIWGSDPLLYITLDDHGALDEYRPNGINAIKDIYQTERNYTLVNERYVVILYNTENQPMGNPPTSYEDLLSHKYKNLVLQGDPSQSSTAIALVAGVWDLMDRDWEYYRQLARNGLFLARKNSDVPNKIMEGEFLAGIAPHDEAFRLIKKAKKEGYPSSVAVSWPTEGSFAIQRPIAISKNEKRPTGNQEIAQNFVDFMISKEAQMITSEFAFVSVRTDIDLPEDIPSFANIIRLDWEYLAKYQDDIQKKFHELF
jgi:iron(III) transport system substrate-binding protein